MRKATLPFAWVTTAILLAGLVLTVSGAKRGK